MLGRKRDSTEPNKTAELKIALKQQRELSQTLIDTARGMAAELRASATATERAALQMQNMADAMQEALMITDHALALLTQQGGETTQ